MNSLGGRSVTPLLQPVGGASDFADGGGPTQGGATAERPAAQGEIVEDIEDDANAARDPRVARRPDAPTKAMVLAHEPHHAEYRDWCEH